MENIIDVNQKHNSQIQQPHKTDPKREKVPDQSIIKASTKVYLQKVFPSPSLASQWKNLVMRSKPQGALS